jgi:hypothetical protein
VICCIAAAFVFGLLVRTVQTVFRRRGRSAPVHPTPVRRIDPAPDAPDTGSGTETRVPVGSGV